MLTKGDKGWIAANFATKGEVRLVLHEMHEGFQRIEGKIDKVLTIVDGYAGKIATLEQEDAMATGILMRHDRQIHALAKNTKTSLPE